MILEVLVCTHGANIVTAAALPHPPRPDVRYLISWQRTAGDPELPVELDRPDIRICTTTTRGLAANRNNALRHASGDILLFSDSDCRYAENHFDRILRAFAEHPEAGVLLFKAETYDGSPLHWYPDGPYDYARRPRGAQASSCEITVNGHSALPRFDLRFGLGALYMTCGEEEIFLADCLRSGLSVRYLPLTIVRTATGTTGTRFLADAGVRRAKGGVCAYIYGRMGAALRCVKFSLFHVPPGQKWCALADMFAGIRYVSGRSGGKIAQSDAAVSVVIPYRNRENFLPRTLESLVCQHHRPLTLILVDNGSTDGSATLCRNFARRYEGPDFRIELLSAPDGGASCARNAGLAAVRDAFVCFFDSDDVFDEDFLDVMLSRMEAERSCDLVLAATRMVFANGRTRVRAFPRPTLANHVLSGMISTQSFVARTDFLRRAGGWNEMLPKWNDYELGVRMLQAAPHFSVVDRRAFHHICQHADSLTGTSLADNHQALYPALSAVGRLVEDCPDARAALAFRRVALAAQWRRAGLVAESRSQLREAFSQPLSPVQRLALRVLYVYMRRGGVGAWRVFSLFL